MRRVFPLLCVLALFVAACGGGGSDDSDGGATDTSEAPVETGDTDADDTQQDSGATDDGSSDSGNSSGLPPGGTGTVTIDGETIEAQWVGNCMIDEMFSPHPDDLDLVVSLDGGLNALFIEIGYEELSDGLLMVFLPELQRRGEGGSYASYQPDGQYLLAPDGNWYLDEEGTLYVALFSGQPHEDQPVPAPVTVGGGSITGSLPLVAGGETVEVSFDLTYVEAVDCSL